MKGPTAPSVPVALPLVALSQTVTVPVEQPTLTDTETAPEGDIVAQAMEQIITPEEWQQLARATPEECGQLEQQVMQHASLLMQGGTSAPISREDPENRTEAQVHTVQMQPMETEMETDNLLQGEIAPLLTIKEQEAMSKQGVYLVVASHVVGDVFVTQIADKFLSKQEQREIRRKGDDILISRTEDSHEVYQMSKNLEPPTFRKRGEKRTSAALGAPLEEETIVSNVAVPQSDTIEQEEAEPREETQEASISEMLESQLESPHKQLPKRRKMSQTLRSAQASVTREDEAKVTEEEESATPTPAKKVSGKNLAALKRQTAADTGKSITELATPGESKTFKESAYGQDRGSTRIWGGKGRGKTGRK